MIGKFFVVSASCLAIYHIGKAFSDSEIINFKS